MQLHAYPTRRNLVLSQTRSPHMLSVATLFIFFTTPGRQACVPPARISGMQPTSTNIETADERIALRVALALTHLLPSIPRRPHVAFDPVGPSALVLPNLIHMYVDMYVCVAP